MTELSAKTSRFMGLDQVHIGLLFCLCDRQTLITCLNAIFWLLVSLLWVGKERYGKFGFEESLGFPGLLLPDSCHMRSHYQSESTAVTGSLDPDSFRFNLMHWITQIGLLLTVNFCNSSPSSNLGKLQRTQFLVCHSLSPTSWGNVHWGTKDFLSGTTPSSTLRNQNSKERKPMRMMC